MTYTCGPGDGMSELDGCAGHGGVVADESMPTRLIPRPEMDPPVDGAISGADSTHTEAFARARANASVCVLSAPLMAPSTGGSISGRGINRVGIDSSATTPPCPAHPSNSDMPSPGPHVYVTQLVLSVMRRYVKQANYVLLCATSPPELHSSLKIGMLADR